MMRRAARPPTGQTTNELPVSRCDEVCSCCPTRLSNNDGCLWGSMIGKDQARGHKGHTDREVALPCGQHVCRVSCACYVGDEKQPLGPRAMPSDRPSCVEKKRR